MIDLLIHLIKSLWSTTHPVNNVVDQKTCPHTEWTTETRANNWRSECIKCKKKAAGSCQG